MVNKASAGRYKRARNLTRWTEEKMSLAMATIWRGHRAGMYKIDLSWVAQQMECSSGGIEQMLDRKHRLHWGPGGPVRGAYNTKGGRPKPLTGRFHEESDYEDDEDGEYEEPKASRTAQKGRKFIDYSNGTNASRVNKKRATRQSIKQSTSPDVHDGPPPNQYLPYHVQGTQSESSFSSQTTLDSNGMSGVGYPSMAMSSFGSMNGLPYQTSRAVYPQLMSQSFSSTDMSEEYDGDLCPPFQPQVESGNANSFFQSWGPAHQPSGYGLTPYYHTDSQASLTASDHSDGVNGNVYMTDYDAPFIKPDQPTDMQTDWRRLPSHLNVPAASVSHGQPVNDKPFVRLIQSSQARNASDGGDKGIGRAARSNNNLLMRPFMSRFALEKPKETDDTGPIQDTNLTQGQDMQVPATNNTSTGADTSLAIRVSEASNNATTVSSPAPALSSIDFIKRQSSVPSRLDELRIIAKDQFIFQQPFPSPFFATTQEDVLVSQPAVADHTEYSSFLEEQDTIVFKQEEHEMDTN